MTQSVTSYEPPDLKTREHFPYHRWMRGEGIHLHRDIAGISDITAIPRKPWARTRTGLGVFLELIGTYQAEVGMFVCEMPPGQALDVQRHLYGQFTLILQGRGATEVWQKNGPKHTFEWGKGSLFAPPKNTYYRIFNDEPTFVANIFSGTVDLVPELALHPSAAVLIQDAWKAKGSGAIYLSDNSLRHLSHEVRPAIQMEPAVLDPRIRTALYYAIDRETISDTVNGGNPQLAAYSILGPSDARYGAVKDTLRPFSNAPDRAKAQLQELGWTQGADSTLRNNADGRAFRTSIWASVGAEPEIGAYASYWRTIGLDVDEHIVSAAEARDSAVRSQFPGFEVSAIPITGLFANSAATAENRWTGNRNGFEDPQAQKLAAAYFSSLTPADQMQKIRAANEYFINQMLSLPMLFPATYIVARQGVKVFDDFAGGTNNENFGSHYRNSHLWDIE